MTIKIGLMPYLNSEVFYYAFDATEVEMYPLVPSAMARAADEGRLDAGPIPLVDCFRLEDRFTQVNGFCIATVERARSILFFSNRPIEALDGAVVAITSETSTSARLAQVLLAHKYQVRPARYVPLDQPHDAYLLIGDTALRNLAAPEGFPYWYDLGQEWFRWTGLPFVFARWVVRNNLPKQEQRWLHDQIAASISAALANVDTIARKRHADLGLTRDEVVEYVKSFHYVIGEEEEQAIARFRHLLETLTVEEQSAKCSPTRR